MQNNKIGFRENKYFLSNMFPCKIEYEGYTYNNVEAAFQAQKNSSHMYKYGLTFMDGKQAKREGRKIQLRPDWEEVKDFIMLNIVRAKFDQNKELRDKLLSIPKSELIEYNTWHDNYWGHCTCPRCKDKAKYNILGIILLEVKEEQEKGLLSCQKMNQKK